MAEASIWIAMASILWMFDLAKFDGDFAEGIDLSSLYTDGIAW